AGVLAGVRHREGPHLVRPRIVLRLALDRVARPAGAYPRIVQRKLLRQRVATLHNEFRDDPVEDDSVVEALRNQLLEVSGRERSVVCVELRPEGSRVGVEGDAFHSCCILDWMKNRLMTGSRMRSGQPTRAGRTIRIWDPGKFASPSTKLGASTHSGTSAIRAV